MNTIAQFLDLANHHPNATHADIQTLCQAVLHYNFNAAFVNPCYVSFAKEQLFKKGKVGTVISFPLGQESLSIKVIAAQYAVQAGADELDVSLNVGYIKEAAWDNLYDEMVKISTAARELNPHIIIKFIPETGYLTPQEIARTAELMVKAKADFFKTCSGMGPRSATIEDVKLVRQAVGSAIKVKVAGGVSTFEQAQAFINAGANRIGTSSAIQIVQQSSE